MKIKLPDIGDFTNVDVIEILVEVGQIVNKNDHLISIETDKASIEVPAENDGEVLTIDVSIGDKISQGDLILSMKTHNQNDSLKKKESTRIHNKPLNSNTVNTDLLVLGAGPGGYTAAFRAADLGLNVTLVERWPVLG
ncbi:MAG: FAD-dependent oxidoreductase, partial [Woeseiaceae bacterium]|nr:FAD-dependent oxidoreductase [Woeseiaceae bacterium]